MQQIYNKAQTNPISTAIGAFLNILLMLSTYTVIIMTSETQQSAKIFLMAALNGAVNSGNYLAFSLIAKHLDLGEEAAVFSGLQMFFFVPLIALAFLFAMPAISTKADATSGDHKLLGKKLTAAHSITLTSSVMAFALFLIYPLVRLPQSKKLLTMCLAYGGMGILQSTLFLFTNAMYAVKSYGRVLGFSLVGLICNLLTLFASKDLLHDDSVRATLGLSVSAIAQYICYQIFFSENPTLFYSGTSPKFFSQIKYNLSKYSGELIKATAPIYISLLVEMTLLFLTILSISTYVKSAIKEPTLDALNILMPIRTLLFLIPVEFVQAFTSTLTSTSATKTIALTIIMSAMTTIAFFVYAKAISSITALAGLIGGALFFDSLGFEMARLIGVKSGFKVNNILTLITFVLYAIASTLMMSGISKSPSTLLAISLSAYVVRALGFGKIAWDFLRKNETNTSNVIACEQHLFPCFFKKANDIDSEEDLLAAQNPEAARQTHPPIS